MSAEVINVDDYPEFEEFSGEEGWIISYFCESPYRSNPAPYGKEYSYSDDSAFLDAPSCKKVIKEALSKKGVDLTARGDIRGNFKVFFRDKRDKSYYGSSPASSWENISVRFVQSMRSRKALGYTATRPKTGEIAIRLGKLEFEAVSAQTRLNILLHETAHALDYMLNGIPGEEGDGHGPSWVALTRELGCFDCTALYEGDPEGSRELENRSFEKSLKKSGYTPLRAKNAHIGDTVKGFLKRRAPEVLEGFVIDKDGEEILVFGNTGKKKLGLTKLPAIYYQVVKKSSLDDVQKAYVKASIGASKGNLENLGALVLPVLSFGKKPAPEVIEMLREMGYIDGKSAPPPVPQPKAAPKAKASRKKPAKKKTALPKEPFRETPAQKIKHALEEWQEAAERMSPEQLEEFDLNLSDEPLPIAYDTEYSCYLFLQLGSRGEIQFVVEDLSSGWETGPTTSARQISNAWVDAFPSTEKALRSFEESVDFSAVGIRKNPSSPRTQYLFCYGSNSTRQLEDRLGIPGGSRGSVQGAYAPDYQRVFRGMSRTWGGGTASLKKKKGATTYGLVVELSPRDLKVLDRYEGVHSGVYKRQKMIVYTQEGEPVEAIAYVSLKKDFNPPTEEYLDAVARTISRFWEGENGPVTADDIPIR